MSAVAVCTLQSSMAQCPLAQPDSSHHELLISSARSGHSCSVSGVVTRDVADVPGVISDYTVIKCEYL